MTVSIGRQAAVRSAFNLAGYGGELRTAAVTSGDERVFVVPSITSMGGLRDLEQVLQQVLLLKVWVVEQTESWSETIPFE